MQPNHLPIFHFLQFQTHKSHRNHFLQLQLLFGTTKTHFLTFSIPEPQNPDFLSEIETEHVGRTGHPLPPPKSGGGVFSLRRSFRPGFRLRSGRGAFGWRGLVGGGGAGRLDSLAGTLWGGKSPPIPGRLQPPGGGATRRGESPRRAGRLWPNVKRSFDSWPGAFTGGQGKGAAPAARPGAT